MSSIVSSIIITVKKISFSYCLFKANWFPDSVFLRIIQIFAPVFVYDVVYCSESEAQGLELKRLVFNYGKNLHCSEYLCQIELGMIPEGNI